ncbi:MAG TPA: flagellar protein FlhE [Eoetvoesiella sp.]
MKISLPGIWLSVCGAMARARSRCVLLLQATMLFLFCLSAHADNNSWTIAAVSGAINRSGDEVAVLYSPPRATVPGEAKITRVYANRSFKGKAIVQSRLCWNGVTQCIAINGNNVSTHVFNGLDASQPMYLVHTIPGQGPLTPPVFVKGNVVVWFKP